MLLQARTHISVTRSARTWTYLPSQMQCTDPFFDVVCEDLDPALLKISRCFIVCGLSFLVRDGQAHEILDFTSGPLTLHRNWSDKVDTSSLLLHFRSLGSSHNIIFLCSDLVAACRLARTFAFGLTDKESRQKVQPNWSHARFGQRFLPRVPLVQREPCGTN